MYVIFAEILICPCSTDVTYLVSGLETEIRKRTVSNRPRREKRNGKAFVVPTSSFANALELWCFCYTVIGAGITAAMGHRNSLFLAVMHFHTSHISVIVLTQA